jgi:hypothetical protein
VVLNLRDLYKMSLVVRNVLRKKKKAHPSGYAICAVGKLMDLQRMNNQIFIARFVREFLLDPKILHYRL